MDKKRKEYLDSLWKDTLYGKNMLLAAKARSDPESSRQYQRLAAHVYYDMEPVGATMDYYNRIFAKEFAKAFKDHKEWKTYAKILFRESPLMAEAMRISAVENGFMFMAEEEILKREEKAE